MGQNFIAAVTRAIGWNGIRWSTQPTPNPAGDAFQPELTGVSCVSARACMAVGSYTRDVNVSRDVPGAPDPSGSNTIYLTLAERWNDTSWSIKRTISPSPPGAFASTYAILSAVSCASASSCVAVGTYVPTLSGGGFAPLVERWNGSRWSVQNAPKPAGAHNRSLSGVSCTGSRACIAVGGSRTLSEILTPLVERWNGRKWSVQPTPHLAGDTNALDGVSCSSSNACTAVGRRGIRPLAERWDGVRWSIQPIPHLAGAASSFLGAVSCPSGTACTAVGFSTVVTGPDRADDKALIQHWDGTRPPPPTSGKG